MNRLSPQQRIILNALMEGPKTRRELENIPGHWINASQKRISELKELGFEIIDEWKGNPRYKVYRLVGQLDLWRAA